MFCGFFRHLAITVAESPGYNEDIPVSATREYQRQKNRESYQRHKEARIKAVRATPNRKRLDRESYERHKEARIAKVRERTEENPEIVKTAKKAWYQKNKEKKIAQSKQWAEENRDKVTANRRRWETANPTKLRLKEYRRKQLEIDAPGTFTEEQLQARIDFYGNRCYMCDIDLSTLSSKDQTIDHLIPLSKGGTNWPANLAPACRPCNSKKHNKVRKRKKKAA